MSMFVLCAFQIDMDYWKLQYKTFPNALKSKTKAYAEVQVVCMHFESSFGKNNK